MGKIITNQDIIKNNVQDYLDSTKLYSKYLEGSPTFVIYYNLNPVGSTTDPGLETVTSIVGEESPNRYNKIVDFPIYGINTIDADIEVTEFGLSTNIESELVILPDTIKPFTGDFFENPFDSKKHLYEITGVRPDKLNTGVQFYRCTFKLSSKDSRQLDYQTVDTFEVDFENIGTDDRTVIQSDKFRILNNLDLIYNKLVKFYDGAFRHPKFNFIYYNNGINIYDPYMHYFINSHTLLKTEKNYMSTVIPEGLYNIDEKFVNIYQNTIYYAIENKNFKLVTDKYICKLNNNINMPFYEYLEDYYEIEYLISNSEENNSFFDDSFFNNIINNKLYDNNRIYGLQNIIIKYINYDKDIFDLEDLSFFTDILLNYIAYSNKVSFILIPCILFIIKDIQRNIKNKLNKGDAKVYV